MNIICRTSLAVLFSLCIPLSANAQFFENLEDIFGCNTGVFDFNNGLGEWTVRDDESADEPWSLLGECEQPGNNGTGGTGDAACTSPGKEGDTERSAAFDTSLISPEFNLNGITGGTLTFKLFLKFFRSTERLDLQISFDGGDTWLATPLRRWDPTTTGRNVDYTEDVSIDLSSSVGAQETRLRFRHYDTGTTDFGFYVQIDDVEITCTGGADLEVTSTAIPSVPIEGQQTELVYTIKNNGPVAATNIRFLATPLLGNGAFTVEETIFPPEISLATFTGLIPRIDPDDSLTFRFIGTFSFDEDYTFSVSSPAPTSGDYPMEIRSESPSPASLLGTDLSVLMVQDGAGGDSTDGCEPLTNAAEIAGKIALSTRDAFALGSCLIDDTVQNVADAGAVALIIAEESSRLGGPILIPLNRSIETMPVFILDQDDISAALLSDATTGLTAQITRTANGLQNLDIIAVAEAEQADPNLENNFEIKVQDVESDGDLDGAADSSDSCPRDPAKSAPLFCGCGNPDTDSNNNGAIDCLTTDEFAVQVNQLADLVKTVRRVRLTGRKKVDRKRRQRLKALKQEIRDLLATIQSFLETNATAVSITSTVDIGTLQTRTDRKTKLALKTGSKKFGKRKRRARKTIAKLQEALNTVAL